MNFSLSVIKRSVTRENIGLITIIALTCITFKSYNVYLYLKAIYNDPDFHIIEPLYAAAPDSEDAENAATTEDDHPSKYKQFIMGKDGDVESLTKLKDEDGDMIDTTEIYPYHANKVKNEIDVINEGYVLDGYQNYRKGVGVPYYVRYTQDTYVLSTDIKTHSTKIINKLASYSYPLTKFSNDLIKYMHPHYLHDFYGRHAILEKQAQQVVKNSKDESLVKTVMGAIFFDNFKLDDNLLYTS